MNFYLLLIIVSLLFIQGINYLRLKKKRMKKGHFDIYKWMRMGSQKRKQLDQEEKIKVMEHKNKLISKIRKEYSTYKKSLIK